jgi:multiple sugar transport system ATP-binding protein
VAHTAKVVLQNLSKVFGSQEAVKDLNLEVANGEFVCLLGPSGCGKTTTLRMIAGVESPTTGSIYFDDKLVNDLTPAERDIAMVFQFYALYPGMTVLENLAFPLQQRKLPKDEIKKTVREVAERLRIHDVLNEKTTRLSVDVKQRVALGRAMVRKPKVYLLDEPLTNLDARLRGTMRAELKKLQDELGQTMIYVTHDQLEGMTMADRIAVMNLGVLQQYDTPENIYAHPTNLFVAGFIGTPTMNFIDCTFVEKQARAYLDAGAFSIDATEWASSIKRKAKSTDLVFGVRPSDVAVYTDKPDGECFPAGIYTVEPTGDKTIIDLDMGGSIHRAVVPRRFSADVAQQVWVRFDRTKLHVFYKKSGEAIL